MKALISQKRLEKGLYWERALSLVEGCTPVSEGCLNCWAAAQAHMRSKQKNLKIQARYSGLTTEDGKWNGNIKLLKENLDLPLRVRKPIVWSIWNDLFHEKVPEDFQLRAMEVLTNCEIKERGHIFLLLTKRVELLHRFTRRWDILENLNNLFVGVTAENQKRVDERIPILLDTPAKHKFVSIEPMLGAVDLSSYMEGLDWVICGGESGRKVRPVHPDWVLSLRNQCIKAKVPFFFKQWGEWAFCGERGYDRIYALYDGRILPQGDIECSGPGFRAIPLARIGKKKAGRLIEGKLWLQMPIVERG